MPVMLQHKISPSFADRYNFFMQMAEAALDSSLPPADRWPVELHEALRYSVFSPGKRLRPVLVLATCQMLGADPSIALPPACAVELIHAYSLVHDDLPCMDNDLFRRGRPTTHVVFGEAIAVLVGDALQSRAYEILSDPTWTVPATVARRVMWELAKASGSEGLVAGQIVDLAASGGGAGDAGGDSGASHAGAALVERIHHHKTGALFRACVRMGAITAGSSDEQLERLTDFAVHFGLAFQIVDDILDVTGDERFTGRPAGSDQRSGKLTFVNLYGLDGARQQAEAAVAKALAALDGFGDEAGFLRDLAVFVVERDR